MSGLLGERQTALNCYLSTIVALAKCLGEICPQAGLVYQDRLLRLSRRLGFDPTPQALHENQTALEEDLAEFTRMASTWINAEATHATQVLVQVATVAESIGQSGDLHAAMLDDLAHQMQTSAEVDDLAGVRESLVRYAAGLRAYAKRKKQEDAAVLAELQKRAKELQTWISLASRSETVDPQTGLLNRPEAIKQFEAHQAEGKPYCVLLVEWVEAHSIPPQFGRSGAEQIINELGKRLVTLLRPRDNVYQWGTSQFAVIFEHQGEEAQQRANNIADWLSNTYSAMVDGISWKAKVRVAVEVIEPVPGEAIADFVRRIDTAPPREVEEPATLSSQTL